MSKTRRSQQLWSNNRPFAVLRDKLFVYRKKLADWSKKKPYRDSKLEHEKQGIFSAIHPSESAVSNPSSVPEYREEEIQAGWVRWLDEVEQLEPEPPRSEPDEYGKALLDKYKRQGLDL